MHYSFLMTDNLACKLDAPDNQALWASHFSDPGPHQRR